jgi:hypothetical protein
LATTTRAILRQKLSETLGDYEGLGLTASSNGSTTTIIDTGLANLPGGGDDDAFEDWYIIVTEAGHTALGEIRRVSGYVASTITLTLQFALSAAVDSADTYELHRIDPALKHLALTRALDRNGKWFYLAVQDRTLVIDDRLINGRFETFSSGAFANWTLAGASAADEKETSFIFQGTSSAKITSASANTTITQGVDFDPTGYQTQYRDKVKFRVWVYATAASAGRIQIDFGSETVSSDYHTGTPRWEKLEISQNVPSGATKIDAICNVAAGTNVVYFDAAYLSVNNIMRYELPTTIRNWPTQILMQDDPEDFYGNYYPISPDNPPIGGRVLQVEGVGSLSTFSSASTDATTTEIDQHQAEFISEYAAWWIASGDSASVVIATLQKAGRLSDASVMERRWKELLVQTKMPPMTLNIQPGTLSFSMGGVEGLSSTAKFLNISSRRGG